jgi:MOSC domain-containing protein YiiM
MGDPQFAQRFARARRPGPYLRAIATGDVCAGDGVELDTTHRSDLALLDLVDLFYDRKAPPDALARALAAPVAERARVDLEERLARRRAP